MKKTGIIIYIVILFIVSCTGEDKKSQIIGEWNLTNFTDNDVKVELTECDKQTVWHFTSEDAEPLGDGTRVYTLTGKAPDNCKWYGFDSKWTLNEGQLFVSTSKIGGMGGVSLAGMMDIMELTENKMVLTSMDREITLERE
ncbi:MAG: lipocalin family protein [Bacteroidota bacterium]